MQSVGSVRAIRRSRAGRRLRVDGKLPGGRLRVGESLAVEGVCLTVESCTARGFVATAVPETLRLTTLGLLRPGARVNLERALRFGARLGGHLVQGHVDGLGQVRAWKSQGGERRLALGAPRQLLRDLVHKGSVAVNGVSLTVAGLDHRGFEVALVPHTLAATTLGGLRVGDPVNLEVDLLARYVRSLLRRLPARRHPGSRRGRQG